MTGRDKRSGRSLTLPARSRGYEVGYAKPPVATRFQPGQSGNPRGRRKGTRKTAAPALNDERLKSIILEEAYRTININDQTGQIDIPMAQAVVRSLAVNAAKGSQRAQRLFTQLLSSVEKDNKRLHDEWLNTAIEYKVEWERELQRRTRLGIQAPAPVPHPDDIIIDIQAGAVRVTGPMTKEEKALWDEASEHRAKAFEEVAKLKAILESEPDHPQRAEMEAEIKHVEDAFRKINDVSSRQW
jgi:hypothetical protein